MKKILLLLTFLTSIYSIGYCQCTPSVTINSTASNTICPGMEVIFTAVPVNGGTPSYIWTSSFNGIITTSTNIYTSSSLSDDEIISVVMTSSLGCADPIIATASITISVNSAVVPSVSILANKRVICSGETVTFTATPINEGSSPEYQWRKNGNDFAGATNSTFTASSINNQDSYDVVMTSSAACTNPITEVSNEIAITVTQPVTAGTISEDQTICTGATPVAFTGTTSTGGVVVKFYKWQSSTTGTAPWVNVAAYSTTGTGFAPGNLTANTHYRRIDSSGVCAGVSTNVIIITLTPPPVAGTISTDQTICSGATPVALTGTASTGGVTIKKYKWHSSPTGAAPWTQVAAYSTTGTGFAPGALTGTTYYRRIDSSGACADVPTNTVRITVTPAVTAGTISTAQTICAGTAPVALTGTASTGGVAIKNYKWESSLNGAVWMQQETVYSPSATGFAPGILTATRHYRRIDSSGVCAGVSTNVVIITITPSPVAGTISTDQTICTGTTPTALTGTTSTGGVAVKNYKWENSLNGSAPWTQTAAYSTTGTDFAPGILTVTTHYRRIDSSGACAGVPTNTVTLNVDPCDGFSTSITGPNPITPGQQNAVYSVPNQTDFTYTWSIMGGTIVSGQHTNAVTVDWDAAASNAFARTTSTSYSISVLETNSTSQTKTTTLDINPITTSVTLSQAQSGINVFPNPTTGSFNIEMPESGTDVTYEILDLTGLSVANGTFTSTANNQIILSDLNAGMYQVVLKYNNVVTSVRLSKIQ